jgi:hypothetical protein
MVGSVQNSAWIQDFPSYSVDHFRVANRPYYVSIGLLPPPRLDDGGTAIHLIT